MKNPYTARLQDLLDQGKISPVDFRKEKAHYEMVWKAEQDAKLS